MTVLGWVLVAAGSAILAASLVRWWAERAYLRRVLTSVVPDGAIRERKDLVALQRHLTSAIRFDMARAHERRPLLRQRARETLETGHGFCGENARVAIRLLRLGGVRAHRLYLFGARWGHVVVEHRWDGGWRLFDANDDPATKPAEDALGRIDTADPTAFPNAVAENPWRAAAVAKALRPFPRLRRVPPPAPVVALAESPDLVRAAAGLAMVAVGLGLLLP